MTEPPVESVQLPLVDPGHPLVGQTPTWWTSGIHQGPDGQRAVVTVRIPNATVSVVLTREQLTHLISDLTSARDRMHGLILAPPGVVPPPLPGVNGSPGQN